MPEIGYRRFLERVADVFTLYEKERSEGKLEVLRIRVLELLQGPEGRPDTSLDDLVEVAKNAGARPRIQVHPAAVQPRDERGSH